MAGHTTHDQRDSSWQGGANLFKAGQPNTGILALRLDFMLPPRSFKAGFCMSREGVCLGCATRWQVL